MFLDISTNTAFLVQMQIWVCLPAAVEKGGRPCRAMVPWWPHDQCGLSSQVSAVKASLRPFSHTTFLRSEIYFWQFPSSFKTFSTAKKILYSGVQDIYFVYHGLMHVRVQVYWPPQKIRTSKKLIYAQLALPLFMPIIKKWFVMIFQQMFQKFILSWILKKHFTFVLILNECHNPNAFHNSLCSW